MTSDNQLSGVELRRAIARMPVALAMFDREMRYIEASRRWLDAFCPGLPVAGRRAEEVHPDSAGGELFELHSLALGGAFVARARERFNSPRGEARWARMEIRPWRDESGSVGGTIVFAEDITLSVQTAEALKESQARLRLALEAQAEAVGRLEAQERRRLSDIAFEKAFFEKVAHEFRNPLATISLSIERVASDMESGHTSEHDLQALNRALRQGKKLARVVDDMAQVSAVRFGGVELRRRQVDLNSLLAATVDLVRGGVEERKLRLTTRLSDTPLFVDGDPSRLEQIFGRLLENATDFTADGGHIEIDATREGDQAVVRVRDNGAGVPPDQLGSVFEFLAQKKHGERKAAGLGVGLALARHFVELHGGAVEARSDGPGRGSELTVRLPLLSVVPSAL